MNGGATEGNLRLVYQLFVQSLLQGSLTKIMCQVYMKDMKSLINQNTKLINSQRSYAH